ncbi:MAG: site-2 protease family protein [Syntrophaceae bacterium]|nr:site-2 protease family protein [Syntrophaceae bacterium]
MDSINIFQTLQKLVLLAPGFLLAITVHEFTHGYVANRLGDPTAKMAGRLTFNPLSHLDPIGTLALVLTQMIGWAKPVPVNPRYLSNPRSDMLWISLGGPAANLLTALVLALCLHILDAFSVHSMMRGSSGLILNPLVLIIYFGIQINIVLAVFNLIPVPPLDGFSILQGVLPRDYAYQLERLEPYGFIILLILLLSGVISFIIVPPIMFIQNLLLGQL